MDVFTKVKSRILGIFRPVKPQSRGVLIRRPLCRRQDIKRLEFLTNTDPQQSNLCVLKHVISIKTTTKLMSFNLSRQICSIPDNFSSENSISIVRPTELLISDKYIKKK